MFNIHFRSKRHGRPRAMNVLRRLLAMRVMATLGLPLLLAACASGKVTDMTVLSPPPRPTAIIVHVGQGVPADASLQAVASALERAIVEDMRKRGLPATAAPTSTEASGIRLDLRIAHYRRGDPVARMAIGFGAGKSVISVAATLSEPERTYFSLDARATSGNKPGLILPGGVAAATGQLLNLAIGGTVSVISDLRGGTGRDVRNVSRAISRQVADYYRSRGPS